MALSGKQKTGIGVGVVGLLLGGYLLLKPAKPLAKAYSPADRVYPALVSGGEEFAVTGVRLKERHRTEGYAEAVPGMDDYKPGKVPASHEPSYDPRNSWIELDGGVDLNEDGTIDPNEVGTIRAYFRGGTEGENGTVAAHLARANAVRIRTDRPRAGTMQGPTYNNLSDIRVKTHFGTPVLWVPADQIEISETSDLQPAPATVKNYPVR